MQDVNRSEHVVVILKRLSHSHQHDAEPRVLGLVLKKKNLREDFISRKISCEAELAGQAERTAKGTSNLRRNAKCDALLPRNENGLHGFAIG